jgi:hypothetical protein
MNKTIGVLFYVDIVQVVDDPHLFTPGGTFIVSVNLVTERIKIKNIL